MKLAIPTSDGLTISHDFRQSRGFLICTLEQGKITSKELRWNLLSEILTSPDGFLYNLADCDLIVVVGICKYLETRLTEERKKIIRTEESNISTLLLQYHNSHPPVNAN